MVILETTIFFKETKLVEKLYPAGQSGKFLEQSMRDNLVQAMGTFAHARFDDDIHSARIGNFQIGMISRQIQFPGNKEQTCPIFMYSICDGDTDKDQVLKCMNEAMDQFINRFSRNDIFDLNTKKFVKFTGRFDKIFSGLIFSMKDRLKQIF